MLHDLVASTLGSAANNIRLPRGLLDGDRILAHVFEPDVIEVARTEAVDTLRLISANNDISMN